MHSDNDHSVERIADAWVFYQVWSARRPAEGEADAQNRREDYEESKRQGLWAVELVRDWVQEEPEEGWRMILLLVERAADDRTLASVAAGPLEDLLRLHPYVFVDRVETEARRDAKFRRCLSGVWGWTSIPEDVQARIRRTWEGEDPL